MLSGVNWGGLKTLYIKEVRRFFKVQMQTVWAPAITTLLYLAIFTVALGRGGRTVTVVPGVEVPSGEYKYTALEASFTVGQQRRMSGTWTASAGQF